MKVKQPKPQEAEVIESTATNLATRKTTAVALPPEWAVELGAAAKDESAKEVGDTQAFSLKSGVLTYGDQPMPDNKMRCIVVASAFESAMFINKYDPNNIVSPLCFALSTNGDDMAPHENSFKPQGGEEGRCTGCRQREWGSDPNSPSGRGKMCKEKRRLILISDDVLKDGAAGIEKTQPALLTIPVTSVGNWGSYVNLLGATMKRPPWAVVTEISVVPNKKNQFEVKFEAVAPINDTDMLTALKAMRDRAEKSALNPYGMMSEEQFKAITEEAEKPKKKAKF